MRFRTVHTVIFFTGVFLGCSLTLLVQRDSRTTVSFRSKNDGTSDEKLAPCAVRTARDNVGDLVHREVLEQMEESTDEDAKDDPVRMMHRVCPFQPLPPPNRPDKRYRKLSHEASARELLYIGIIAYDLVFFERCRTIVETWGHATEGHLHCYATSSADRHFQGELELPVIGLKDFVREKKLFKMLQYMAENYLTEHDFFLVAQDQSAYISIDRLKKVLQRINPLQPLYMGYSRLTTFNGKVVRYCFLELGVVLSRSALAKLVGSLAECLAGMEQSSLGLRSDEILGGCLAEYVGVQCTWSDEVQDMFYLDFNSVLNKKEASLSPAHSTAISVAPVKTVAHTYRLHRYMLKQSIEDQQQLLHRMKAEFVATDKHLRYSSRFEGPKWPWLKVSTVQSREDLFVWHYFNATHFCSVGVDQPMRLMAPHQKAAVLKVMEFVISQINLERNHSSRYLQEHTVYDGFWHHDPLMGDEYILRVIMTKRFDEQEQVYVNAVVPLEEPGALIWHPWGDPWDTVKVDMIVAVAPKEVSACLAFLENFKREAIQKGLPVVLHLVVSKLMEAAQVSRIKRQVDTILTKHPSSHVMVHSANISDFNEACRYGAGLLQVDRLMIILSIHITFFEEFLTHAVTLTLRGQQVYLPVPFQFYHASLLPRNSSQVVSEESGFWDMKNFEVVAMYIQDYESLGHLGPGESVLQRLVAEGSLSKVRGLEPHLRIDYEGNPQCRPNSKVAEANLESVQGWCTAPVGSRDSLSNLAWKHKLVTRHFINAN